ncbi:MAG: metal ABC transporter ATP-binding protein [Candidatus Geothermincolia bacterium]
MSRGERSERENVVEISGLSYHVGDLVILEDVNLNVARNSFLGIIGPNGAGKTTLLKIILGLTNHYQGTVRVFGRDPRRLGDQRYRIGYLPQLRAFERDFPVNALEVVLMGRYGMIGMGRHPRAEDRRQAMEALERVEMADLAKRQISRLSGGQQQRVFIARALVNGPDLLIMDEPTVGIDTRSREAFSQLVLDLKKTLNLTVVLVSHDPDIVASSVDKLACVHRRLHYHDEPGKLSAQELEELYECPLEGLFHGERLHVAEGAHEHHSGHDHEQPDDVPGERG